jgi:prevent-host-death family protein
MADAVTIHEAKTHLSRLIAQVEAGAEIILARGKTPVAKIVPLTPIEKPKRVPGRLAHLLSHPDKDPLEDGFWDPLPDDHLGL